MKQKGMYIFMTLLVLATMVLSGCSSAVQHADTTTDTKADDTSIMDLVDERIMKDNKTEVEHTQGTLMAVIEDGVYEKQITYAHHAGEVSMDVSITIENEIITAVSIVPVENTDAPSQKYMNVVNDGLQDLVVGKHVNDAEVPDQLSGSSLTTVAFRNYLSELQSA